MKSARGFTLIELLVVIAITSILAVMGFVNFKDFSSNQISVKAAGEIQTILRLAQSNATSSTLCDSKGFNGEGQPAHAEGLYHPE